MREMRIGVFFALLAVLLTALPAAAQPMDAAAGTVGFDWMRDLVQPLLMAVVFTVAGLVLFGACIWLIVRISPFSVRREIEEDQNVALGIIVGAMILGIAIILSAALLG